MNDETPRDDRAERRAERLRSKRERMPSHGRTTATVYRNAILKRLKKKAGRKQ